MALPEWSTCRLSVGLCGDGTDRWDPLSPFTTPRRADAATSTRMKKLSVLFICVHNSARSQMAAAFLNRICPDDFEAQSAGVSPGVINPLTIQVLMEVGIDISSNTPQAVFDVWRSGAMFQYVIRVCSEEETENRVCAIFPGPTKRLSWPFADPSRFNGSQGAQLEQMRLLRDAIERKIRTWCEEACVKSRSSQTVSSEA